MNGGPMFWFLNERQYPSPKLKGEQPCSSWERARVLWAYRDTFHGKIGKMLWKHVK